MAKGEFNLSQLKRYTRQCSKAELERDLAELFTRFEAVRDYFQSKLDPADNLRLLEKYKEIIKNEFFPRRGFGPLRLSVAKKAISDYKKVCTSPDQLTDLMLYYVETGVEFTNTYGDIDASFYSSMESMYKKVLHHVLKYGLQDLLQDRCARIDKESSDIGWGFHDAICDMHEEALGT